MTKITTQVKPEVTFFILLEHDTNEVTDWEVSSEVSITQRHAALQEKCSGVGKDDDGIRS